MTGGEWQLSHHYLSVEYHQLGTNIQHTQTENQTIKLKIIHFLPSSVLVRGSQLGN